MTLYIYFKRRAVLPVLHLEPGGIERDEDGLRDCEIGLDYGVYPGQIGLWKKEIQEQAKTLFEGKRGPKPVAAHQQPELLYSEIGKLKDGKEVGRGQA